MMMEVTTWAALTICFFFFEEVALASSSLDSMLGNGDFGVGSIGMASARETKGNHQSDKRKMSVSE